MIARDPVAALQAIADDARTALAALARPDADEAVIVDAWQWRAETVLNIHEAAT